MINLNDTNFLIQCAQHYKTSYKSTSDEFFADIKKIKYIKKLLTRYRTSGKVDVRLILNHIIILNNVFGPDFLCRLLYLKLGDYFDYLKPFLLYLNVLPPVIISVNDENVETIHIKMDLFMLNNLKELHNREIKNSI